MFDFHMHSTVSFDGHDTPETMVRVAEQMGLREICFTDHIDHIPGSEDKSMVFDAAEYARAYDNLTSPTLRIRRGMEFGMTPDNQTLLRQDLAQRDYDFVLGSVHFVDGADVYYETYWEGKTYAQAVSRFLEGTLETVRAQDDFDVLAHLTFLSKARANPLHAVIHYEDHREIADEILRTLAAKGKGLEMNTSGVDRCGDYLPPVAYFRRFRELGGEIVTIGSDAHTASRVGQYSREAARLLKDIFGYVCTFENRRPIFHRL
ncbi:MAG: histidinol-phosphatase HisJ family protein [Faecousia sp.]